MEYDVTIGIPVYNSADCLRRTLISALSQTYSSIEFMIVDDASQDDSLGILKNLQNGHPRGKDIHIVSHASNIGVARTRNQIIDEAQGRYLYFMDSDDVIAENTIELLMQNARQYNAEIVYGSYEKIELSGEKTVYQYPYKCFSKEGELAKFAYRKYAGIQASACNCLIEISVLRDYNYRFVDADFWEDFVFTFDLVTLVSRAVLLPDITYSYICREHSLSHYQKRSRIAKDEIMRNVQTIDHLKVSSSQLCEKDYFPERCCNIVLTDFYIACNILKRRSDVVPWISDYEIKSMMSHPATLRQICTFRHGLVKNLFFFLLSVFPASLSVFIIRRIGKLKKLI